VAQQRPWMLSDGEDQGTDKTVSTHMLAGFMLCVSHECRNAISHDGECNAIEYTNECMYGYEYKGSRS